MKKLLFTLAILINFISTSQEEFGDGIYAVFSTTKGEIVVQLEYQKVPLTVGNFVALAEGDHSYGEIKITKPFYDGLKFHRVIADFMIQGGDPQGNGSGGPGYKFSDEFDSSLVHSGPGVLSMANSGANTNGSQFFITHKATPWLNMKHSVFGNVVKGQDVVDSIAQGDVLETLKIVRIGKEAKKFNGTKVFNEMLANVDKDQKEEINNRKSTFKEKWIKKYPDMQQTESGLMYQHTVVGEGDAPVEGNMMQIQYIGYLEDGTQFESSYDRPDELQLPLVKGQILEGWYEAFLLMKTGGKLKIVLPPWLGFGNQAKGQIPPNAHLIFDFELIKITDPEEEMKEDEKTFKAEMSLKYPESAGTKSGLLYQMTEEGNGSLPKAGQEVEVHYTGYLLDGSKFDSSVDRGQTFKFTLGQGMVIKGWDEGIQLCKVGGKIKLIIPYWLAYGAQGRPPQIPQKAHLIFDVEVIAVK
jgi:peptidyl-prolyl cis-trans isomerase A (cyclophilin A)